MIKEKLLVWRNAQLIAKAKSILTLKCAIANEALEKLKKEGFIMFEMNDDFARDIEANNPSGILAEIRNRLVKESVSIPKFMRETRVSTYMEAIEPVVEAIFEEKKKTEERKSLQLYSSELVYWEKYIRFDGKAITFDADALEEDNSEYVHPRTAAAEYLEMAKNLAKSMSEFAYITCKLSNGTIDAVSSSTYDTIIDIDGKEVCLALRNIASLDFTHAEKVFEDSALATFTTSSPEHHP